MQKTFNRFRLEKSILIAAAFVALAHPVRAAVEQDIAFCYAPSYSSSLGGEANAQVSFANVAAAVNFIYDQSGTGAHWHIAGYYQSVNDPVNWTTTGGMVGWLSGNNANVSDVVGFGNSTGADLLLYVVQNGDSGSIAGVSQQPGMYSSINPGNVFGPVVAHEIGGHAYGGNHQDGHIGPSGPPKTIMMHNYCVGGGSTPPYFFSNPNIWWNGTQLLGNGQTCLGGSLVNGGDNTFCLSANAQGVTDRLERPVTGPDLTNLVLHWCFTNSPGAAPAGTTNHDLISGAPAVVRGNGATYTGSALRIPGGTTGNVPMSSMSAYIDLPNGILSSQTNITIEIWATPLSAPSWARILEFGSCAGIGDGLGALGEYTGASSDPAPGTTSQMDGITLTAAIGTDITQQRFESRHNGLVTTANANLATTAGVQHFYTITFTDGAGAFGSSGGRWQWYRDGDPVAFLDVSNHLSSIQDVNDWLGRSEWSADSLANNDFNEVRISNVAMSREQVSANYSLGPNFNISNTTMMTANDEWNGSTRSFNTSGNWSDGLAPGAGKNYDMFDFNLITPNTTTPYTFGGNSLRASGGILFCGSSGNTTITVPSFTIENEEICNGTTAGGSTFNLAGNLNVNGNCVARGSLGPINLSANLTGNGSISLYGNTTTLSGNNSGYTGKVRVGNGIIGSLNLSSEAQLGANPSSFTPDQLILNRGWLYTTGSFAISNSNRGILIGVNDGIFDVAPGTTLTLGSQLSSGISLTSATQLSTQTEQSGVVAGALIKQDSGTLVLKSPNSGFTGILDVDSSSSSGNDGAVRVANSLALANASSPIYIRNSGTGSSTLQLDGSASSVLLPQNIALNGRNNVVPAIENLSGTNTLSGGISPYGSGSYIVQVDSGVLNIGGSSTSSDGGSDTITFQGNGAVNLNGAITGPMSVNKSGNGSLAFGSGSSYTGSTTVSQGTVVLQSSSPSPVLHLTFNNSAGSANGAIITNTGTGGTTMNGTIVSTGGASIVAGGRFGNALSLNGTGGSASNNIVIVHSKVLNTDASGSWSVGYWLKTATAGAVVMYQGDGAWSSAGQTTFYLNNNSTISGTHAGAVRWAGGWLTGTAALNNNAWHFVTLVGNAGTESIYVDGNLDAVTSSMANPLASDANQIWIGGSPDSGDGTVKMSGLIDEVFMFNRALSQTEVQSLFNNNAITNAPLNTLPVTTTLNVASSGILDLAGVSQTIAGLSGSGLVTNSGTPAVLTISNSSTPTQFSGQINDASSANAISLVISGTSATTLAGANNYRGATTVNGGTLQLSPVANDAVLHLAFDIAASSGNGTIITNSGTGGAALNGTIVSSGGASIVSGGRFGNALNLNGTGGNSSNNIVIIPGKVFNTDASGSWTVGYWIKTTTAGAVVMYQGDGTWSSAGQTTFYLNNNGATSGTHAGAVRWAGGWLTGTAALNNNAWHFVTIVDNAGTESIYVDGNVDAVTSSMANPLASDANQIWIGGSPDGGDGTAKMVGLIDEVYMFNRALSQTEVQSLYDNNNLSTNFGNVLPINTSVSVASSGTFDLGGVSQTIASLTGSGTVANIGSPATLTLSNNTGIATFSGSIGDLSPANALSLVQNGGSTNVLSGSGTYHGTTTVNSGTLLVNGSLGSGSVTINNSGTLAGNGTIGGAVTAQSGGTLSPGGNLTTLTVNNNVSLLSGSTTLLEISKAAQTNDQLIATGTLSYGGALIVTNLSGTLAASDTFQLFVAGAYNGSFSSNSLPALNPGLAWNTSTLNSGSISVVSTVPTNLTWTVSGTNMNLSWPAGYTGWRLQVQSNNLAGTNWVDVPGSTLTNSMVLPVDPSAGSLFYRLIYP